MKIIVRQTVSPVWMSVANTNDSPWGCRTGRSPFTEFKIGVGVVQSRIETLQMETIARQTRGVLRVENRLVTRTGR